MKDGEADPDHIFLQVYYPNLLGIKVVEEDGESRGGRSSLHLIELSIKAVCLFVLLPLLYLLYLLAPC